MSHVEVRPVRGGKSKVVHQVYADILVKTGRYEFVADAVPETADMKPSHDAEKPTEAVEISPRTGKPKRRYKRRDVQAEKD